MLPAELKDDSWGQLEGCEWGVVPDPLSLCLLTWASTSHSLAPAQGKLGKSAMEGDSAPIPQCHPASSGLTVTKPLGVGSLPPIPCFCADTWQIWNPEPTWAGAHLGVAGLVM